MSVVVTQEQPPQYVQPVYVQEQPPQYQPQVVYTQQPMPQAQYQPQPQVVQHTHVTQTPVTTQWNKKVGQRAVCQFCSAEMTTNVTTSISWLQVLSGCGIFWMGGILCCWIPCVIDDLGNSTHHCGSCGKVVGVRGP